MKIKLLKPCRIGGEHCDIDEVVSVSDNDAKYMIGSGSAVAAEKEAKVKAKQEVSINIKMLKGCLVAGEHRQEGDCFAANERDAAFLLSHGYAETHACKKTTHPFDDMTDEQRLALAETFMHAVEALDEANCDGDWTQDGRPDCRALKDVDLDIPASVRDELWKNYQADREAMDS